jgi:hypothetical protein
MLKADATVAPDYVDTSTADGAKNVGCICSHFKSSATSPTTYSRSGNSKILTYGVSATGSANTGIAFKSKTTLSVFIAGTSYGFAANIEYAYIVMYSS